MSTCYLCDETYPDVGKLLHHAWQVHPNDAPERWPDGLPVVYDEEMV